MSNALNSLRARIPEMIRGLPPFSLGIAAIWVVAALAFQFGFAGQLRETREAHDAAASLASREPVIEVDPQQMRVVRAVDPKFENDALLEFMRGKQEAGEVVSLQNSFDALAARARMTLDSHPFRTLGHVPAAASPQSYVSYFLVHATFGHVASTLLLFLLVAPLLEARWGMKWLAFTTVLCIPLGAAVHSLTFVDSQRALIGGGTLVAALSAAVLIRFWGEEVEPLEWLSPLTSIDFRIPAWGIGVVWIGYEALLWATAQGALPPGVDNDPGYAAHGAAAVFGFMMAVLIAKLGLEKPIPLPRKTASPAQAKKETTAAAPRFDLPKVVAMREGGEEDEAFQLLSSEVRRSAGNRDVVMTYWQMAIERGLALEAASAMKRLLEQEMRRGAKSAAVGIWRQLTEQAPDFLLDSESLFRLVPMIREEEGKEAALEALKQVIDRRNHGLTAEHAAKVARWTAEIDPELSASAAQRALDSLELDEKQQAELELLAQALSPQEGSSDTGQKAPAASAFFEESDRSAFGASEDLSDLTNSFPDGAVTEALPRGAEADALQIQVGDREPSALAYTRIRAVSIVGVRGLAEKPIVLFDLLIDGRGTERPLSVMRFRCDRFDPRPFAPNAKTPREALQALLQQILSNGNAQCLVDATTTKAGPDTLFDSLDAYHAQVLRPASGVLG